MNTRGTLLMSVCLTAVVLIGIVLIFSLALRPTMDAFEWQEETYRVQAGDSLWVIANEYCPDGVDCREWIGEVKELNGLDDSTIYTGQTLTVLSPVK